MYKWCEKCSKKYDMEQKKCSECSSKLKKMYTEEELEEIKKQNDDSVVINSMLDNM